MLVDTLVVRGFPREIRREVGFIILQINETIARNKDKLVWQTETGVLGQIMTATYDKEGNLNGPYKKYYYDSRNPTGKIEWKGQFGMVTQSLTKIDPDTGENVVSVLTRSERTGTWTKYDQAGKVLLTVTYDWKSNANDK